MAIKVLKQTMIDILRKTEQELRKPYGKRHLYVKIFGDEIEEWGYIADWAEPNRWLYRFPDVSGLPDGEKLAHIELWIKTGENAPPIELVDWI